MEEYPTEKEVHIKDTHSQESEHSAEGLLGPTPTEEELQTLRKVADKLPLSAWFVAIVELAERFTYYGASGVFMNYMQLDRDNAKQTGGLGWGHQAGTALSYFFQFWCYVTPIPMSMVADMWLGKYNTIVVSSVIYVIGTLILFVTSLPVSIGHIGDPSSTGTSGKGGLVAAMIIIGIGTGGIKSNVSTLIADQYTNTKPYIKTLKSGERVIVDPTVTIEKVFHLFYMCINVGSLSAIATTELEAHVDFWAAFLLPFCFFFLGILALFLGRNKYIRNPPSGSPIPNAYRICAVAIANGFKRTGYRVPDEQHVDKGLLFNIITFPFKPVKPFFHKFNLDVAKPTVREEEHLNSVPWTDTFVEEVRRALYGCKVFLFYPIYWVVYGQMINNFISQAGQMNTHGIPNDLMQNIDPIAIIIFIPIMEYVVYPLLRKAGFPMQPITRIAFGFAFGAIAMGYAAICQHLIYTAGPCYDAPLACEASQDGLIPNDIHVAIQTPAYFFIAMSEILASITGLEYAYTKAPVSMKSFVMALFLLTNAFGSAIGIALSSVSVDPKILWQYVGLAGATAVAGTIFWCVYSHYNTLEESFNQLEDAAKEENYFGNAHDQANYLTPRKSHISVLSNGSFNPTQEAVVHTAATAH